MRDMVLCPGVGGSVSFIPRMKHSKTIHRNIAERILRYYDVTTRHSPRPPFVEQTKTIDPLHEGDDEVRFLQVAIQGDLARMERRGFQLGQLSMRIAELILQGAWVDESPKEWKARLTQLRRIQDKITKRFAPR